VLQQDVRNVDALLGLGAIAERQGRMADANSWYNKVLETEPKNSHALTGLMRNQPQTEAINTESYLKNMLAKNPEDANIQAALGNYYAENNDWPAAQQAYFEAYRLRKNADNAFNLAVSLDQMGKPKLALPYYQHALEAAQNGASSGIDIAALQARIAAIQ
jgi:tetratricopeptide (TPR) repeat protein